MESARQWRATRGQFTLDLLTEEFSRPPPRCSTVEAADGPTRTEKSEIWGRRAGYIEELYRVDPRVAMSFWGMLKLSGMMTPLCCDSPTLEETRRAVNQLKSGKIPGGC